MVIPAFAPRSTRPLLLYGPTASGKSALALALAAQRDAVIINADSMQVYRDLRVLTARPTDAEEALAPHALYGEVDAAQRFSVGRWLSAARTSIEAASAAGRLPIVVGGTGLYFKALTHGLVDAPAIAPAIRRALQDELAQHGAPALHARLAQVDPAIAARLSPRDAPRILRALEVAQTADAPLSALQAATAPTLAPGAWVGVALAPPREQLYAAIDRRFDAMLAAGALEEARALAARGLDSDLPAMKAHGMPWLAAHLRGEMTLAAAADAARRDTRRYAKRQFTWMAGQMPDWPRITATDLAERLAAAQRVLA